MARSISAQRIADFMPLMLRLANVSGPYFLKMPSTPPQQSPMGWSTLVRRTTGSMRSMHERAKRFGAIRQVMASTPRQQLSMGLSMSAPGMGSCTLSTWHGSILHRSYQKQKKGLDRTSYQR